MELPSHCDFALRHGVAGWCAQLLESARGSFYAPLIWLRLWQSRYYRHVPKTRISVRRPDQIRSRSRNRFPAGYKPPQNSGSRLADAARSATEALWRSTAVIWNSPSKPKRLVTKWRCSTIFSMPSPGTAPPWPSGVGQTVRLYRQTHERRWHTCQPQRYEAEQLVMLI
jgi:hypothetical protein